MNQVNAQAKSNFYQDIQTEYNSVWPLLVNSFALNDCHANHQSVTKWIHWYTVHPQVFKQFTQSAAPWIHFVAQEVINRGMPGELALLPFIESGYDPTAINPNGSSGLWQFMPATARELGLHSTSHYAGRRDVIASTRAALTYLQRLHDRYYPQSWQLTLAAYNSGPKRVNNALHHVSVKDFWHLQLPQETQDYVPKLLALAAIIVDPAKYGVDLAPIANQPTFIKVKLPHKLTLKQVAHLAQTDLAQITQFNPAHLGTQASRHVILPINTVSTFKMNLAQLQLMMTKHSYTVSPGDTLSAISQKTGISIWQLKLHNQLLTDRLKVGQKLILATK